MERKKEFIINTLYISLILLIIYVAYKYVFSVTAPILIGLGIAFLLRPLTRRVSGSGKISKGSSIFVFFFFCVMVISLITIILSITVSQLMSFLSSLPQIYEDQIEPSLQALTEQWDFISRNYLHMSGSMMEQINSIIPEYSGKALSIITSIAGALPDIVLFLITVILSSMYFTIDYDKITTFLTGLLPERTRKKILPFKQFLESTFFNYLKSSFLLMLITIAELFTGFLILGIDYPLPIALGIAILDFLPFFGVGAALVPWIVILLINGNFGLAAGLTVLLAVISIIRSIIEPKILGKNIGVHPLAVLVFVYVGYKLFGLLGILTAPFFVSVVMYVLTKKRTERL